MRLTLRTAALLTTAVVFGSCSNDVMMSPRQPSVQQSGTAVQPALTPQMAFMADPDAFISEIHYDNASTDVGEAVEISVIAGYDITGLAIVLYNGGGGVTYDTDAVTAAHKKETCGGRDFYVVTYPVNGIQNGNPDGLALVQNGSVLEFLTYGGPLTATNGPASGTSATNIGVTESGTTPIGNSLQRRADHTWAPHAPATFGTCNTGGGEPPPPPPPPPLPPMSSADARINEVHYDNASTDAGEGVEIEGVAGLSIAGWKIVLYNGSDGATYSPQHTFPAGATIPASCGTRGVVHVEMAGMQNGHPDGIALIDAVGAIVQFISYGASFTATNGPAAGLAATSMGVQESGTTPVGHSLQRGANGAWQAASANTFGACNDSPPPPPPASSSPIVIHELMGDPVNAESASWGEWFEVYNTADTPIDLQGWTIRSGGQGEHTITASLVVAPHGYAVLGRGADIDRNGGVVIDYNYFVGLTTTIFLDDSDWLALRAPDGTTADSVRWTSLPRGVTRGVRDPAADNSNVNGTNWGFATTTFGAGDYGTPDAANAPLADAAPAVASISISLRAANEPPLPVGFMDQAFGTYRNASGTVVPGTIFTWASETPGIISVDERGNVRALAEGPAVLRATAPDGVTRTLSFTTVTAVASSTADYDNIEFGIPTDGDASDDFIVTHPQYTGSYSSVRNSPNWVSYNLDPSHIGNADRCNCFTQDPQLPASFAKVITTDYSGDGTFDRGHLAPSADRTAGTLDNATTFYFSNIVPQEGALNSGPWANLEAALRDSVKVGGREVYIVTGIAGAMGTVENRGLITIPRHIWKVALILPLNHGLADVDHWTDVTIMAVNMPNVAGTGSWTNYLTTVDAIEALSGYDLYDLLPDAIERIVESGTRAPVAKLDGPYTGSEGSAISMSGETSTDPDSDALSFVWSFGDGATATGGAVTHTYAQDGTYEIQLVATDVYGLADTTSTTVTVSNVAPVLAPLAGASLLAGETFAASASFIDPGADSWTASVAYGDGATGSPVVSGMSFDLSHVYANAGTFTVTVTVSDGSAQHAVTTQVVVLSAAGGIEALIASVDALVAAGALQKGNGTALNAPLDAALRQLRGGNETAAVQQLEAFINQVAAFTKTGRLMSPQGAALTFEARRVIASILM